MKFLFHSDEEIFEILAIFEEYRKVKPALGTFAALAELERTIGALEEFPHLIRQHCIQIGANIQSIIELDEAAFGLMLLSKHRAYGAEPITQGGIATLKMKLNMKIGRLKNLIVSDQAGETPADTLQDILGYAVLGYAACKHW